ncbi:MAG: amidohydrolase [Gemmatimonadales bacterium]|nr:MAG: amidohydrolase [Gemmatimonadales bacterium]
MIATRFKRCAPPLVAAVLMGVLSGAELAAQGEPDSLIPLGTTKGERYNRLVIRGVTVISGRGTPGTNRAMPPEGPVDVVIEGNVIVDMVPADPVNLASRRSQRPTGDRILDASGMYLIPGLVDMHAHLPRNGGNLGPQALEYTYRIYLGHGVTAVRDAGTGAGIREMAEQRRLSAANQIVAPRLVLCQRWPLPLGRWNEGNTPEKARAMVREFKALGADCVKVSKSPGHYPDVLEAIVQEANAQGMFVMTDLKVSETDAAVASRLGVRSIEHWYGVPDAALPGSQNFPPDYNYWDELDRFRWAGRLWEEADQYPERLSAVIDLMIRNGTNWDPTMVVYEKNRDLARAVTLPWRETLVHPHELAAGPDSTVHGAYHREWKTSDEVAWKRNFQIWMKWVREFHRRGGLLTAGSDDGELGGISLIRELELMQEAGIHPIDIFKVATTNAYQVLGWERHCGVRVGCIADLAVVNGNPIDNLKVMYGRGYGFYGILPREERVKHGGVKWTIKDGVVYDAQALLREAEWYVAQEKRRLGGVADGETR